MDNYSSQKAKEEIERLIEELKQERDEMILKVHLMKADAKDEWQKVDKEWEHFKAKSAAVGREAKDASEDVTAALKLLGEEILQSFIRIKKSL